jgi:hypothetical protein
MDNARLARSWLVLAGAILVVVGILGFIPNALVGPSGLVATDNLHNIVHLVTGVLAVALAYGMAADIGMAAILFGALYVVIFVACLVSPNLFGLFSVPVNGIDHLIHAGLAIVSLALGYMARNRAAIVAR